MPPAGATVRSNGSVSSVRSGPGPSGHCPVVRRTLVGRPASQPPHSRRRVRGLRQPPADLHPRQHPRPARRRAPCRFARILPACHCHPSHCIRGAGVGSDLSGDLGLASASVSALPPVLTSIPWLKVGFRVGRVAFSLSLSFYSLSFTFLGFLTNLFHFSWLF